MRLINKSKNTVLAENLLLADTPFRRMIGLLGKDSLHAGQALLLAPCNSVHTFFMRFAIDLIFLDKNDMVIKTAHNCFPNKSIVICWGAVKVIELPAGKILSTGTQLRDKIQILD
ncbi:MAG: DUF192 domain-containing protein [Candidatus Omnitrophica bacterium]|jgi:hypothetical protein|nr:DUF192 domain-containing protein [Candidatus Omnitrophota bacterium]